ncbi:MAG TPA: hypothetical protein VLG48_00465 [Candidatus Methylomirabilis sp.]|nr:hypothetical protein [Candidatus Methylomirabilis sp.]
MEMERGVSSTLRPWFLVKTFLVSALFHIPLSALLGMGVLVAAASAFPSPEGNQGTWSVVAGWSLTGLYALAGLIGGGLVGTLAAAARTFSAIESGIRDRLQQWQPAQDSSTFPSLPLQQVRERYEQVMDQMYAGTLGRMRLPGFLERFVRSRLRQAIIEDFLADCQRRGMTTVGFPELRQWLVTKGLPLVTAPVHTQLGMGRLVLLGGLSLLAVLPFALRLVGR